jgi:hypothetical protein
MENNEQIEKQKEFAEEYKKLCAKHGMELTAVPQWMLRDDGTYSMRIQFAVKAVRLNVDII